MDQTLKPLKASDIPLIIEKASLFGGKIHQAASLTTFSTRFERMDVETDGKFKLKLPEGVEVNPEKPISISLNYRSVTFLLYPAQYSIQDKVIIGEFPKEARAIELRSTDRFVLPLNRKVTSTFHRIEKRPASPELTATLVDVSIRGLGITITGFEEDALKENDHLWLKLIDESKLEKPVFARVVYVVTRHYKDAVELKAGISLEEAIPETLFEELQERSTLVLKA